MSGLSVGAVVGVGRRVWAALLCVGLVVSVVALPSSVSGASGGRVLVVASELSLSDVGTAASLVAGGGGDAVLLSGADGLSDAAEVLVGEVAPGRVVIVGGTAVVPESVRERLGVLAAGVEVERLAGADRVETAALVAGRVLGGRLDATVVLAYGWSPADVGVAASFVAGGGADAVLYVQQGSLGDAAAAALRSASVAKVVAVGGTAVLPDAVLQAGVDAAGVSSSRRLGGATRVETAARAARAAAGDCTDTVVVANGWVDADVGVAAALAAALEHSGVLYAESADVLGEAAMTVLDRLAPVSVVLIGGTDALSETLAGSLTASTPRNVTRIEGAVAATQHALAHTDTACDTSGGSGGGGGSGRSSGRSNRGGGTGSTVTPRNGTATLSALTVSPGMLAPEFAAATLAYTVSVANDVAHLTVTPTTAGTATATVSGTDADPNTDGHQVALAVGTEPAQTTVTIAVEDGTATASYTITVTRAAPAPFGLVRSGRFNIAQNHPDLKPSGLWSDGTSMWIGHHRHRRTYSLGRPDSNQYCASNDTHISVFDLETGGRESGRDIHVGCDVNALWSDGETLYAAAWDQKLNAYDLQTRTPRPELDVWVLYAPFEWRSHGVWSDGEKFWSIYIGRFTTAGDPNRGCRVFCLVAHYRGPIFYNVFPSSEVPLSETIVEKSTRSLWSDGHTMWIAHQRLGKLIAYDMATGERNASLDFGTLADAGVGEPSGMWSDGRTMFVADNEDRAIYEFKMPTLPVLHSLELSGVDIGHFRLSKYGYEVDVANTVTSTTVSAEAAASSSAVAITPADADANAEGDQVSLSVGANEIEVTVTEGTQTRTYTVTVTRAGS